MNGCQRRQQLKKKLMEASDPISGSIMAVELGVSRQVIVQDIALLRAGGESIISTAQGYVMINKLVEQKAKKIIACQHNGGSQMSRELYIIVELGGTILDVIVEHPLYGELKAVLMLKNSKDVDSFLLKLKACKAEPLSVLTNGVHLHTIEAKDTETLKKIEEELGKLEILLQS